MSELLNDPWIDQHSPIEARRLHAIGFVTYTWNRCELALYWVFREVLESTDDVAWVLSFDMGDIAMSQRIEALVKVKNFSPDAAASISNALKIYDVCRRNRNQLTHFAIDHKNEPLRKPKKPVALEAHYFPSGLEDIRRVADDLITLEHRLWNLAFRLRNAGPYGQELWLTTLPLPELLWKART